MFGSNSVKPYELVELHYVEFENEINFSAFRLLLKNQENSLEQTSKEFQKRINDDEVLKSLNPSSQDSYYTHFFESEENTIKELRRKQRYSVCLSLFSFFEGRLQSICSLIESKISSKIKLADLSSKDGLKKYWVFLEKVFEIENELIKSHFNVINQQKVIRNIIAHSDGVASKDRTGKISNKEGIRIIKLGEDSFLELEPKYLLWLMSKMDSFLKELLIAVDETYKDFITHKKQLPF